MPKVLIVEDDQPLALAYQKKFTQEGFEVSRADDGASGITKALEVQPDIIILDIMLPGKLNGFDVLRELKLADKTKGIPVIVMTNLAEEGQSAKELGANEYLLKVSVSLQELVGKVEKYLKPEGTRGTSETTG